MKKLELKSGMELKEPEMMALNGGSFLKSFTAWGIISSMISSWGDIREGFSDGYNQVSPRH